MELGDTDMANGWQKDDRVVNAIVTVTKEEGGALAASVEYPDGHPVFTNKYYPPPPPPPPCDVCKYFDCLPFPMLWFSPPQKPEFARFIEKFPLPIDDNWLRNLFRQLCNE